MLPYGGFHYDGYETLEELLKHIFEEKRICIFFDENDNLGEYFDYVEKCSTDFEPRYLYTIDLDIKRDYLIELAKWKGELFRIEPDSMLFIEGGFNDECYVWLKNSDIALFDDEHLSDLRMTLGLFSKKLYYPDYQDFVCIQVNTMSAGKRLSELLNINAFYLSWTGITPLTSLPITHDELEKMRDEMKTLDTYKNQKNKLNVATPDDEDSPF